MPITFSLLAVALAALTTSPAAAQPADPGTAVRQVFAAKCSGCHGPDLPKPKGRFGYVLDLRRVADNPEMVIPGRPDESELWALVKHGDMPPEDSPRGPLTEAEKETVHEWIAAGAPAPARSTGETDPAAEPSADAPVTHRAIRWLGKFHLLALHFPIALVFAAGVAELLAAWKRERAPSATVRFCLWLGAVAAVPTAALGWLHAASGNGAGSPQLLLAHRSLGTITGLWLVLTVIAAEIDARRGVRARRTRLLLAVGVLLTLSTAHLGGTLAHGRDFFDW